MVSHFQNFLVYMFFLLVVLLLNYSDSAKDAHGLRLRNQLQQVLHTPEYHNISRYTHHQTDSELDLIRNCPALIQISIFLLSKNVRPFN